MQRTRQTKQTVRFTGPNNEPLNLLSKENQSMSAVGIQSDPRLANAGEQMVNDFAIVAATVNGSGSQTANTVLIRALFKMGIPVNGKNLFPSNIAGLPTWYTIRLSKDGFTARRDDYHVLVAMNPN